MALCQTTLQVRRRETIVRFSRQFLDCVVRAAMQAIAVHYGKLYLHLVHFRACCSFLSSAIDLIINVCWEGREQRATRCLSLNLVYAVFELSCLLWFAFLLKF